MNWNKCTSCGRGINYGATYQKCGVSSCRKFSFCSVDCWNVHNEMQNHKSAYAEEETAPPDREERSPRRILVKSKTQTSSVISTGSNIPRDILIVTSKLKDYVKQKHNLNTSADVTESLSNIIRYHVDQAIDKARADGRKTLMGRDFE